MLTSICPHDSFGTGRGTSRMASGMKASSENATRYRSAEDYYDQYPICEYCGHIVFPGEEQEVDHGSLFWHSAHCFRCYGCHRELVEERKYHLLPEIALCDDCYPRREYFVEEFKSLQKGEGLSNKQRRVCFLSPVIKPESNARLLSDVGHPGTEKFAVEKNAFYRVPRQLAFAQSGTPQDVENLVANLTKTSSVPTPARVMAVGAVYADPVQQSAEGSVEAQIAQAMEGAALNAEVPPSQTQDGALAVGIESREKMIVDEKFTVVAVNEWEDVVSDSPPQTECVEEDQNLEGDGTSRAGVSSAAARLEDMQTALSVEEWRRSQRGLRRTSSCSDLYKAPAGIDALSISNQKYSDSNQSNSSVEFRSFRSSDEKEEIDPAREAELCSSPSPVPQSSTPIPQSTQCFVSCDRPPSSFCEESAYTPSDLSRTVPPQDYSLESCGRRVGKLQSFQEIRAIFQKAPEGRIRNICCICRTEVFPMDRFDCLHQVYHLRCFRCSTCKARLNPRTFRDDGKQPYCKTCFLDLKVSRNRIPRKSPTRYRLNSM